MLKKFNQYNLTEILNKKYSHSTYLASPADEPGHQVILNVFASSLFHFPSPRECENLLQKAQRIRQLQHPRLMSILDVGIEQEQPFIVREYLPNESLRGRLKKLSPDRLTLGDALTIILQLGGALAYAHEYKVVHGNIKPENILFDGSGQIVLTDFSLVSGKDAIIRDQTAEEYGFCYMAPEQLEGVYDARSDQYALACVAYELITGQVPFTAQNLKSGMEDQRNVLPVRLSESIADLPHFFEAAILKALARDPAERFFDFSLFLDAIQSVLSPPPAFPLVYSDRSHGNRPIMHSIRLVEAGDVSSPISNGIAHPVSLSQLPEPSRACSSVEVCVAEPVSTASLPLGSVPEWVGSSKYLLDEEAFTLALQCYQLTSLLSEKAYPIDKRGNGSLKQPQRVQEPNGSSATKSKGISQVEFPPSEQGMITELAEEQGMITELAEEQAHDVSLTRSFMWDEVDALPGRASESSAPRLSKYTATEGALLTMRSPKRAELPPVLLRYGTRKVIVLAVFLLATVALLVYNCLPLVMTMPNTRLHTASNSKMFIPQATSDSTVQVSAQVTSIPTLQASPVTDIAKMRPVVSMRTSPATPVMPPAPISYEAEALQNSMTGIAKVISCSGCSGGYRVGYLGLQSNRKKRSFAV